MVALSLFRVREGGALFINQRQTLNENTLMIKEGKKRNAEQKGQFEKIKGK